MASYTCNSCGVEFDNSMSHRSHYKTDWHRYNLRRRQVELAPVPYVIFRKRKDEVLARRRNVVKEEEEAAKEVEESGGGNDALKCEMCRKTFASVNAQRQHLHSKKHKAAAKKENERPEKKKEGDGAINSNDDGSNKNRRETDTEAIVKKAEVLRKLDATRELDPLECLFCTGRKVFSDEKSLVRHMECVHEFSIPEVKYVSNTYGLLKYLGEKVGVGHMCMYCQKGFGSVTAVRGHMIDVGHCKIPFEVDNDLDEYLEFYAYPPLDRTSSDAANAWHAAVAECNNTTIPSCRQLVIDENEELVLWDGRRVGNRKYRRVYEQNCIPMDNREEVVANRLLLLERAVGPEEAKALMKAADGGRGGRSTALSLFHARDRQKAKVAATRDTEVKKRHYEKHALSLGIQSNKVNVSKIPHRRGIFVSWKK